MGRKSRPTQRGCGLSARTVAIEGKGAFGQPPTPKTCVIRWPVVRVLWLSVVVLSACSVVKTSTLRPDWPQEDQRRVRRLAVVVEPLLGHSAKVGELMARVARRYVNLKRDFLVKREIVAQTPVQPSELCGGDDAIEGVLLLQVTLTRQKAGFEAQLHGALLRCGDARQAWSVTAGGSFASKDERLTEVTQVYVREVGPEVEPYVALTLNLLRPALDTLPQPVLTEDDVNEKLSLD